MQGRLDHAARIPVAAPISILKMTYPKRTSSALARPYIEFRDQDNLRNPFQS